MINYKDKYTEDGSKDYYAIWHIPALKFVDFKNKKVLDLGCGSGGFLNFIHKNFNCEVCGIDPNSRNIEIVKKNNIQGFVGYANEFENVFSNTFDIVTSFEVLEHVYSYKDLFLPAYIYLRNNSPFIISTPNAFHLFRILSTFFGDHRDILMDPTRSDEPEHIRLYSYKMMKRAFIKSNFKNIKIYGIFKIFKKSIILKNKFLVNYFSQHLVGIGYK